ncbi:MAG: DUF805 domain-containing protein [Sphingobacteriales bacterium]|nr:DUF805 domain-containing protein [Sphingobacteriales bacterium]
MNDNLKFNYYIKVFRKYASFKGRASEREFWYFTLFNVIVTALTLIIDNVLGISIIDKYLNNSFGTAVKELSYGPVTALYRLLVILPTIAVSVRRIHDVGKSGIFLLVPIYSFILILTNGDDGDNKYGRNTKIQTAKKNDEFYIIITSLLFGILCACSSYALLNETKVIDGLNKSETIKGLIFIAVFVFISVFFLAKNLNKKSSKIYNY